ncbi:MAG TPA: EF-P lysine aminoacylase EpmA [Hyphomicrobiaceae bacterium]|nr:EF-P lysine aminoacylase EpmA [Hyphomicrobiaceae bacterium]
MPEKTPFWRPSCHADRRPLLIARNRIRSRIRAWFEAEGFTEVDTACLQISPGNETHLHAFETSYESETGRRSPLYLHTSPEFAMKKLLAAGETRIFNFAPCFRNAELSRLHAPEFTMLEWYRVGARYETLMDDCATIARIAADVTGRSNWTNGDLACDATAAPQTTTVSAAFAKHAGIDLDACSRDGIPDIEAMKRASVRAGLRVSADDTWSDLFSRALAERIEPRLGHGSVEMLTEYPAHEAALARLVPGRRDVAERFEMYIAGVEIANGFGELTDAAEQRRRLEAEMDEKQRIYGRRYPIDEDFLAALATMPDASGCALGFDRLVMLATGAPSVASVQWAPVTYASG